MDHASMQHGQQHGAMDHSDMEHAPHAEAVTQTPASPGTGALPRTPIPEPTAEEIAAAFAPLQHHAMHAPGINHYVLLDRLEAFDTTRRSGQDWEARAWIGGDIDRLWLRSEGERQDGARRPHRWKRSMATPSRRGGTCWSAHVRTSGG